MLYFQEAVVEALQVVRKAKQILIDIIGCNDDGDDEREEDSDDDMGYTEDAIDNMILELSRD